MVVALKEGFKVLVTKIKLPAWVEGKRGHRNGAREVKRMQHNVGKLGGALRKLLRPNVRRNGDADGHKFSDGRRGGRGCG